MTGETEQHLPRQLARVIGPAESIQDMEESFSARSSGLTSAVEMKNTTAFG